MPTAIIIGNGESRKSVDLQTLKKYGKTYGANALYREFVPDVLVAMDTVMIREIMESGYYKEHTFYPRRTPMNCEEIPLVPNCRGWASGSTCAWIAIQEGATELYFLGFDLIGINGKINNIYKGTLNYRAEDSEQTYYSNWEDQLEKLMIEYPNVQFIRVSPGIFTPSSWKVRPNYKEQVSLS